MSTSRELSAAAGPPPPTGPAPRSWSSSRRGAPGSSATGSARASAGPGIASLRRVFTGIVRERGRVVSFEGGPDGAFVRVEAPATAAATSVGDSVAIDGCCLTAVEVSGSQLVFQAVPETLRRTSLPGLGPGTGVNVEPALRAGEPLGGHFVQGHVDGVGRIRSAEPEGDGRRLHVDLPPELLRYCVEQGSIAIGGVSLTVAELDETGVAVALVPHTLAETTLAALAPGDKVNVEVDVLAKYVDRLLDGLARRQGLRSPDMTAGRGA